jgi:Protein of unknown function (DUF1553)/Protein of unknown function (DUF1549)
MNCMHTLILPLYCALVLLGEQAAEAGDGKHWAFVPPVRPAVPSVRESSWARNPIDRFILARMERERQKHAPEADRSTLLRRLCFDLTGLPPSLLEQRAFLSDSSREAYDRLVDRLLASPQYGERSGQHWLDLARFAETDGFEFDQARPDAWRYRDWVVEALNRDLPYDVFVRLQLAGDEVRADDPWAFIATGFNRCYPDMVDLNDQSLRRQNALDDITETTGLVFLGLTIGCARCHDHKFDPIPQTDYYHLQAFFAGARFRDDYSLASPQKRQAFALARSAWERELGQVQAALIRLEAPWREKLAPGNPPGVNDETAAAFAKTADERSAHEVKLVFDALKGDRRVAPAALRRLLDEGTWSQRQALFSRLDGLMRQPPADLPKARGIDETGPSAPATFLLRRGDFTARGPEMKPVVPAVLATGAATEPRASSHSTGRRNALADWLVRPGHPLTARVIVNRLWQHHFGRGLVATASDFGAMGEEPSHPELLDWLATELIARGWSMKAMHRLIVTSAAYRQSSVADRGLVAADPDNLLLGRQNRRRLDGEAIRDALLFVSGSLNSAMKGPSVFPELPPELSKLSSKGAVWPVSPRVADRRRRSLYVFIRRNLRYPFFEVFDRPDTNASCPRRPVTTIAPQALSLLNSGLAHEAARALAARAAEGSAVGLSQAETAARLALGRVSDPAERQMIADFLARGGSIDDLCLALLNTNAFLYVD